MAEGQGLEVYFDLITVIGEICGIVRYRRVHVREIMKIIDIIQCSK